MHEVTGLTPRSGRRLPGTWGGLPPPVAAAGGWELGGVYPPQLFAVMAAVPLTPVYPPQRHHHIRGVYPPLACFPYIPASIGWPTEKVETITEDTPNTKRFSE